MKGLIMVDPRKCTACKTCEIQCALVHSRSGRLEEAIFEETLPQYTVRVESVDGVAIPLQCRHCEDAPCVAVCPTKAMQRSSPGEPVIMKRELCIGCKWCLLVCPFGSIDSSRDGRAVVKCDLCIERQKAGRLPACVEGCPTGALKFVPAEDIVRDKRKGAAFEFLVAVRYGEEIKRG